MQCIYCLKEGNDNDFTHGEHVIPEAFGKFKNNFVLRKIVCNECNQYFGDNLETDFARDTYEGGIARYEYKIKKPCDLKSIGKRSRIKIRILEGFFKGAYAYREYVPQKGQICLSPLPQVGFLKADSSGYDYFLLDEIPGAVFFNDSLYNINNSMGFVILGCDHKTAADALKRKGFSLRTGENRDSFCIQPGSHRVYGKGDRTIMRAIAKIGFNYLAYWEGAAFVLQNAFDPIRKYIRTGEQSDYPIASISKTAILPEERVSGLRKLGHIIVTHWMFDGASPFVFISIFNWTCYAICLAKNFSGEKRNIARGHFFNLQDKKIVTLKQSKNE